MMGLGTAILSVIVCLSTAVHCGNITFLTKTLTVQCNESANFALNITSPFQVDTQIYFLYVEGDNISSEVENTIYPIDSFYIKAGDRSIVTRNVTGMSVGNLIILANGTGVSNWNESFMHVYVVRSWDVKIISAIIGWCYFAAWSVSFYPQVILNFTRKSVVGLNFDFVVYNLTGFLAYSVFNVAMYFIPSIFALYEEVHPRSVNPVELNDVIFALHAFLLTIITLLQIACFERGGQIVSRFCIGFMSLMWMFLSVSLIVAVLNYLSWLTYLYFFSYCKLVITLIKYVPQAYFNYIRRSTDGWSVGNVLLDFTGGSLSILQMVLLGYNNDDWNTIFGNPTKFGLGLFSVLFDVLFIVQHYCLYRGSDSVDNAKRLLLETEADAEDSLPSFAGGRSGSGTYDSRDMF